MTIVAIHQPNFFPWLGYFDKIVRSDSFVILDDVQLPKKGGTWSNRVKTINNGEGKWLTAPIVREYSGVKPINEVYFDTRKSWRVSLLSNIIQNYKKAACYDDVFPAFEALLLHEDDNIARYNTHTILDISKRLGINVQKICLASSIEYKGQSNDMLVDIVRGLGGSTYMCGGGADTYQDEKVFSAAGVALLHQNFEPPPYKQMNTKQFVGGLSIIDPLMNIGWAGVSDLLNVRGEK